MIYINNTLVDKVLFKEQDISCYAQDVLVYPYSKPIDKSAFITEYETTLPNQTIKLPISGVVEVTIDYDDGSSLVTTTSDAPTHTYANAGKYEVKITGKFTLMDSMALTREQRSYVKKVINWGDSNIGITRMYYALYSCHNLTSIPPDTYGAFTNVSSFVSAFYDSQGLTSIPQGLFDNCQKVTSFQNAFANCSNLTSIPISLFDECTKCTDFAQMFSGCTSLTGTVPYDSLGGTQAPTPLYQRSSGVNGYAMVTVSKGCFKECTKLSDYSSIPSGWKQ